MQTPKLSPAFLAFFSSEDPEYPKDTQLAVVEQVSAQSSSVAELPVEICLMLDSPVKNPDSPHVSVVGGFARATHSTGAADVAEG